MIFRGFILFGSAAEFDNTEGRFSGWHYMTMNDGHEVTTNIRDGWDRLQGVITKTACRHSVHPLATTFTISLSFKLSVAQRTVHPSSANSRLLPTPVQDRRDPQTSHCYARARKFHPKKHRSLGKKGGWRNVLAHAQLKNCSLYNSNDYEQLS